MTTRYSYQEFFEKFPKPYLEFERLVSHSENFERELDERKFFEGAKTVLSIGCGEGSLELATAERYKLNVDCIDPSAEYILKIESEVSKRDLFELVRTFNCGFQEFDESLRYDRILSIHSWYAFGLDMEPLRKAMRLLGEDGRLFITVVSTKSPVWRIHDKAVDSPADNLSAELLHQFFLREGLESNLTENYRKLPRERILQDGKLTLEAQGFVSFLNFCPWSELTGEQIDFASLCLNEAIIDDSVVLVNGCIEIAA